MIIIYLIDPTEAPGSIIDQSDLCREKNCKEMIGGMVGVVAGSEPAPKGTNLGSPCEFPAP